MSTLVDIYTLPSSLLPQEEKIALLDAELYAGNVSWGDYGFALQAVAPYLPEEAVAAPEPVAAPVAETEDEVPQDILDKLDMFERAALEDWKIPNITMRKGIWEHFPVVLTPIEDGDGTDRYAVSWHRKNLAAWRNERSQSWDEYQDYEDFAEIRLLYALATYDHKYVVEDARSDDQICVIAMVHAPAEESSATTTTETVAAPTETVVAPQPAPADDGEGEFVPVPTRRAARSNVPVLTRLNDIKEHFPVVWRDVPSRNPRVKIYAIELFGKKIRELSAAAGRDLTDEIGTQLTAALKASNSWRVLRSEGREFCRIEMS